MKKKPILVAILLPVAALLQAKQKTASPQNGERPNVIVLVGDDVGYGDLGWLGSATVQTPNVNRVADEGIRFSNCHATSATSTPSRYGLLTGLYPWRRNDTGIAAGNAPMIIRPEQYTLADLFHQAGYATAAVGKWHLGLGDKQGTQNWNDTVRPNLRDIGFDYSYIMAATADRVPCVFIENGHVVNLDKNDPIEVSYASPFPGEPTYLTHPEMCRVHPSDGHACSVVDGIPRIGYMKGGMQARWHDEDLCDSITEHALRFIDAHRDAPFFLYFGTNDIHVPRVPHERFQGVTTMGPRGDAIVQFDYTVGRVTHLLDSLGIADKTLLIITSDNGPVVDDGYADRAVELLGEHKPGGGFRGGKYSIYEAGTRVPFMLRWPGHTAKGKTSDAPVSLVDMIPSMASLLQEQLPEGAAADAENHLSALLGQDAQGRGAIVEQNLEGTLSITRDGWKYIEPSEGSPYNPNVAIELGNHPYDQLYYLPEDPAEQHNMAVAQPERVRMLRNELERIKAGKEERNLLTKPLTMAEVGASLVMDRSWVPYPAYSDREGWKQLLGAQAGELIKRGEKQLNYQWKTTLATDYLAYQRTGNRKIMEEPQSANHNALNDLVLAELAEGKGRFMDQIINGVWQEMERTSWVLSAHLFRQESKRNFPDYREQLVDLGAGEIGGLMAWTLYFFADEMDKIEPFVSAKLRYELHRRIIEPYWRRENEWWLALHLKEGEVVNNWNPWCNFNVLQVLMLTEQDSTLLTKTVWRSMRSVDKFLNYVKADGACEEGPSYWGHAAGKLFDYLDLLKRITGGRVDLFQNEQVRQMGEYVMRSYIGDGWVVNFADASAKYNDNLSTLMYRYGKAIASDDLCHFAAYLAKDRKRIITGGTDIYRSLAGLEVHDALRATEPFVPKRDVVRYKDTQFCYMSAGDWYLATKGGHNNESHNHNDVGTCTVYYKGQPVLIDAGVGTYTAETFSSRRYQIWTMQSAYHNLPTINGVMQHNGAQYRCKNIDFNEKKRSICYEIAGAYPKEAGIQSWQRGYALSKSGLTISDRFAFAVSPTQANQLNWLTQVKPDVQTAGKIKLQLEGEQVELVYNPQLFTVTVEPIALPDKRLSNVWGDTIYRILLTSTNISCRNYEVTLRSAK